MKKNGWHVVLHRLVNKNEKGLYYEYEPNCNPKESGKYLCTVVNYFMKREVYRGLAIMEYHADRQYWSDVSRPNGISYSAVLAWRDDLRICQFNDFVYEPGGILIRQPKGES